jgi:hypothetical protein
MKYNMKKLVAYQFLNKVSTDMRGTPIEVGENGRNIGLCARWTMNFCLFDNLVHQGDQVTSGTL